MNARSREGKPKSRLAGQSRQTRAMEAEFERDLNVSAEPEPEDRPNSSKPELDSLPPIEIGFSSAPASADSPAAPPAAAAPAPSKSPPAGVGDSKTPPKIDTRTKEQKQAGDRLLEKLKGENPTIRPPSPARSSARVPNSARSAKNSARSPRSSSARTPRAASPTPRASFDSARYSSSTGFSSARVSRSSRAEGLWDDTPYKPRPPALRGLNVHCGSASPHRTRGHLEAWARDESVYNVRFNSWSSIEGRFHVPERAEDAPERVLLAGQRRKDYMNRFYDKFAGR